VRSRTPSISGLVFVVAVLGAGCSNPELPPAQSNTYPTDAAVSPLDGSLDGRGDVSARDASPVDDGGPTGDGDAGDVEAGLVIPAACPTVGTWSMIARVASIAPAGFDRFGGISAGGLSVAWTTSAGAVYVSDRSSTADPFGMPALLDPGAVVLANGRVALMPTGLELVATLGSGSSFVSFFRTAPGGSWAPTSSKEFETVATMAGESGGTFSDPVVSADGESLFYLLALPNQMPVLFESAWDPSLKQWGTGVAQLTPEFAPQDSDGGAQVRRATGASSDRLTLFFFDDVAGNERAAWRLTPTSPFTTFTDLAGLPEAAPTGDCSVLYFHGSDARGQGLFTGTGP
jgi:hypothetical protein